MLSKLRYEPGTKTIRTVPGNHWVATLDSWDGTIKPDLEAYGHQMAASTEMLDALQNSVTHLISCSAWEDALNGEDQSMLDAVNAAQALIAKLKGVEFTPYKAHHPRCNVVSRGEEYECNCSDFCQHRDTGRGVCADCGHPLV